jgi:hypothetical protein
VDSISSVSYFPFALNFAGQTFGTMNNFDSPRMCFNGAKSWYLGWYTEGHQVVDETFVESDESLERQVQLVGIDDYNRDLFDFDSGDRVILKLPHAGDNSTLDLYVMYNRKRVSLTRLRNMRTTC